MTRPSGYCAGNRYRVTYPDGTLSGCGRYLTAGDFELHRVQRTDVPEYARRCLSDAELLAAGWIDVGDGSWSSPARRANAAAVVARLHPELMAGSPRVPREPQPHTRGSLANSGAREAQP